MNAVSFDLGAVDFRAAARRWLKPTFVERAARHFRRPRALRRTELASRDLTAVRRMVHKLCRLRGVDREDAEELHAEVLRGLFEAHRHAGVRHVRTYAKEVFHGVWARYVAGLEARRGEELYVESHDVDNFSASGCNRSSPAFARDFNAPTEDDLIARIDEGRRRERLDVADWRGAAEADSWVAMSIEIALEFLGPEGMRGAPEPLDDDAREEFWQLCRALVGSFRAGGAPAARAREEIRSIVTCPADLELTDRDEPAAVVAALYTRRRNAQNQAEHRSRKKSVAVSAASPEGALRKYEP